MSEGNAVQPEQTQVICRVTKRSRGSELTGAKVFCGLERLGVSAAIRESLQKAQEKQTAMLGDERSVP